MWRVPVDAGVNSQHDLIHLIRPTTARDPRCLRHTVWMAACDDCRHAHAEVLSRPRPGPAR